MSTSAYYAWLNAPQRCDHDKLDRELADKAKAIFVENKQCFGSRRLANHSQEQGLAVGRFKTRRIMRDLKLQVRYPKRFKVTTDSHHNEAISPNQLDRQFQVAKPNQVWTTDITYVWTLQGCMWQWLSICFLDRLWAGRLTIICAYHCVLRRYRWHSGVVNHRLDYFITQIVVVSMRVGNTANIWR